MRNIVIVFLATLSLLVGCNGTTSPKKVVDDFIRVIGSGHPDKTACLINDESQPMITRNLAVGHGIAWIAAQASHSKDGYRLVVEESTAKQATVILKGSYSSAEPLLKSKFPPKLQKQGVRFYLVKESHKWKIDLFNTEDKLSDIGLKYLCTLYKGELPGVLPPWMPTPPGMGFPSLGD